MMNYFIYNGKLLPEGEAVISADNRGLRYGDGLFETMRINSGRVVFEDEHFNRLWNGMNVLGFDVPAHFTKELLIEKILLLAKKNGIDNSGRIRLTVMKGDGGLYDAVNLHPLYLIQCWPIADHIGKWNSNGLVVCIYDEVRKSCDVLSNLKHNNFLPYVMAAQYAKKHQANDALVLNDFGRIADTTIANIFIVKNDVIRTPHLKEGCIAGIMRESVIRHLQKNGWEIEEGEITPADVLDADEVFLTNSIQNIRWVQRIGDSVYQNDLTHKIYNSFLPTIS